MCHKLDLYHGMNPIFAMDGTHTIVYLYTMQHASPYLLTESVQSYFISSSSSSSIIRMMLAHSKRMYLVVHIILWGLGYWTYAMRCSDVLLILYSRQHCFVCTNALTNAVNMENVAHLPAHRFTFHTLPAAQDKGQMQFSWWIALKFYHFFSFQSLLIRYKSQMATTLLTRIATAPHHPEHRVLQILVFCHSLEFSFSSFSGCVFVYTV